MGLLGGLFGGSDEEKGATADRCMECGMTGGEHTDWCPTGGETRTEDTPAASPPPDDDRPESPGDVTPSA